jgi:hypothetical protein
MMRGGLFAAVCVGLSQAGHDLMAPHPVPEWSAGAAFVMVAVIGYRLGDRECSTGWILAAVETVQLYLHVWFAWTTPAGSSHDGAGPSGDHLMMSGHQMVMSGHEGSLAVIHGGMSTPVMFAAHAVAGAFVAVWLSVGEHVLWRVLRSLAWAISSRLGLILALVRPGTIPARLTLTRSTDQDDDVPGAAMLRHAVLRRGPPRSRQFSTYVV